MRVVIDYIVSWSLVSIDKYNGQYSEAVYRIKH